MKYGLIGERLGHSFSREIHSRLADYSYELCELMPDGVESLLRKRDFCAINVTIPYKETVIPMLDEISPRAARIGAVNTVVNRGGRLFGYNTDYLGAAALIRHAGVTIKDKKVLILGTGGTSKTLGAVASDMGARSVVFVSRRSGEGRVTYDEAYACHRDAEVIVNTTPVGMFPQNEGCPIDIAEFPALCGVADVVYNPLRTRLVAAAQKRGIVAGGGLYMLVAQAVYASALFRGIDICDVDATTENIYRDVALEKSNIVLIGMPSCGKSTIGGLLAERTGRRLIDTDVLIENAEGRKISDIFARDGEAAFRTLERAAIAECSRQSGCVIATGGGVPLDERNISALRQNGKIIFIDRPLELLSATSDRPLALDREALARRYEERYPIYRASADMIIDNSASAEDAAAKILSELAVASTQPSGKG